MTVSIFTRPDVPFPWAKCSVCGAKLVLAGTPAEMKAQAKAFEAEHAPCERVS